MPPFTGLRVVEGSAFVAAPLGGLTLAQLGADVIRFDTIGGGLDYARWPVTDEGVSLYWSGLNKGKRSIAFDLVAARGPRARGVAHHGAGRGRRALPVELPRVGMARRRPPAAQRAHDLVYVNIVGNPDETTAVDYTVNAASGHRARRPGRSARRLP